MFAGSVEHIGFTTTPTMRCFYKRIEGDRDAYGLFHKMVEQDELHSYWVSSELVFHMAKKVVPAESVCGVVQRHSVCSVCVCRA